MSKKLLLKIAILLGILGVAAFAGTGGSELNSWYTDISGSLKGTWGKIIAVAFLALTLIMFKGGSLLGGAFMAMLAFTVGIIPDIVDARYTALMFENSTSNIFESFYILNF
ncbi:hypothetical protein N5912_00765 [Arcobacter lacus]|uniref:hypothetical protein n=1 Tax=Arcobacter lacus TaxID=1912876 RepID=UPI0021BB9D8C|nr:hypothetical protein [Arcobacter lacus]MCT7910350.1 hypothetical protein [Arcobacter lacus]